MDCQYAYVIAEYQRDLKAIRSLKNRLDEYENEKFRELQHKFKLITEGLYETKNKDSREANA